MGWNEWKNHFSDFHFSSYCHFCTQNMVNFTCIFDHNSKKKKSEIFLFHFSFRIFYKYLSLDKNMYKHIYCTYTTWRTIYLYIKLWIGDINRCVTCITIHLSDIRRITHISNNNTQHILYSSSTRQIEEICVVAAGTLNNGK